MVYQKKANRDNFLCEHNGERNIQEFVRERSGKRLMAPCLREMSLKEQPSTGRKNQGVSRHKTFHMTSFVLLVVNVELDLIF